ncbi:DNA repair protein XRCC2-like [Melia azedarach]|uniref:DNA repair protein XRCC2-like n=2 Tax=Melia azedarach TaxID=155640 RepID=A0ACC1XHZ3_MELAZ|nr:DNA repair protein XRCC2-like [Melia azedarach]KAJ4710345.1 DNA repair protein XRCC2-like [Melia azedarach]
MTAKGWIDGDETAGDMLSRLLTEQLPFLLLPPLHRLPLRVGNVVELVGPSASAKTQILMQAAISCILPKEWKDVHYGGLGRLVMFIDLDCRFDVLRFSQMLKHRIMEANGLSNEVQWDEKVGDLKKSRSKRKPSISCDEELFALCMRRFLYVRCYDSFEFLATLKTLHCRLQQESEAHGIRFYFLMIDSIGAFHWVDRACRPLPVRFNNRKSLSLRCLSETVVQEIRNLLLVHPMVVIASKAIITVDKNSANEVKWKFGKWFAPDTSYSDNIKSNTEHFKYHEYMPSVWQTFVTHRIVVQPTGEHCEDQELSVYLSQWLLPPLKFVDKFAVGDAGVIIVS